MVGQVRKRRHPVSALTITHKGAAAEVFAPTLEVLKQEVADKAAALVISAAFEITDPESFAKANNLATVMHATEKDIEARRVYLKRPLTDTGRLIEAAVDGVASPLALARKSLVGKIAAWDKKQKEAALAAQREAERKAEEERVAKQKAADEAHAAQVKAEQERAAKEAAELEAILGKPVTPEPVKVAPAPVVEAVKPTPIAAPVAPSAVTTRLVPKLVVTDPRKVAALYQVGMEVLVRLDEAAIKRAIEAGSVVDGAHIEMVEQTAMRGVRS